MLPATAPFYMGLAAGWAIFLSNYIQHNGEAQPSFLALPPISSLSCIGAVPASAGPAPSKLV